MSADHRDYAEEARLLGRLIGCEVTDAVRLDAESRNAVLRVSLKNGGRAILKYYTPQADRAHWANRFRREEKVLTLLAGVEPAIAPHPLGGFIAAKGPAALLMEDAGEECLADVLSRGAGVPDWCRMADFVMDLHAGMAKRQAPLKRTAMSISLDRINGQVLLSRFRIASERILADAPPGAVVTEYKALLSPLLASTRAIVHNSLSPLNVVMGPKGWLAIDWETLTWASPLWDWAEFLRAPYNPPPFEMAEALVVAALDGDKPSSRLPERWQRTLYGTSPTEPLFWRAVLGRHMDSLATVTLRRRDFDKQGRPDRATEYGRRARFYAEDLTTVIDRLKPEPRLAAWLWNMIEGALA